MRQSEGDTNLISHASRDSFSPAGSVPVRLLMSTGHQFTTEPRFAPHRGSLLATDGVCSPRIHRLPPMLPPLFLPFSLCTGYRNQTAISPLLSPLLYPRFRIFRAKMRTFGCDQVKSNDCFRYTRRSAQPSAFGFAAQTCPHTLAKNRLQTQLIFPRQSKGQRLTLRLTESAGNGTIEQKRQTRPATPCERRSEYKDTEDRP